MSLTFRRYLPSFLLAMVALLALPAGVEARLQAQQSEALVIIYTPQSGGTLQGSVPVDVGINVPNLVQASLEFRYSQLPGSAWFLIAQSTASSWDGILAQWDTTVITDGEYDLHLVVVTEDNQEIEYLVTGLRVRNYTPIETDTPTPTSLEDNSQRISTTVTPLATGTSLPPTMTPLPTNPAIFTPGQFSKSALAGILFILSLFVLAAGYIASRRFWLGHS